eukprot:GHVT01029312.1.p2 GENE.GHVT01029312.1~~GHVT01029312.1.p2  ORF type:complete len:109 (-),score=5.23 GHVT01029312.1:694-1020(-)
MIKKERGVRRTKLLIATWKRLLWLQAKKCVCAFMVLKSKRRSWAPLRPKDGCGKIRERCSRQADGGPTLGRVSVIESLGANGVTKRPLGPGRWSGGMLPHPCGEHPVE